MRVVVTGGSGKLGRAVVDELATHGWDVANVDAAPPRDGRSAFTRIDLTDFGQVVEAFSRIDSRYDSVDAVVHLAAIPGPGNAPNAATFANNVVGSYNVFAAARAAGIRNVVWASSETVLGLPFDRPPDFAPIDETIAPRPESSYALSKLVGETMAAQMARRSGIPFVGLRISNIMEPHDYARFPSWQDDARVRKWNLWGYVDARDVAAAIRGALESTTTGAEVCIVAADDTVMTRDSADLLREVFPDVPLRRYVRGRETLLAIDRARDLLGYRPQHRWQEELAGTPVPAG